MYTYRPNRLNFLIFNHKGIHHRPALVGFRRGIWKNCALLVPELLCVVPLILGTS
jgi:hypothetical protein